MVEFALVVSLFLVLLIGIIDWAIIFFQHEYITWKASEAARWAVTRSVDQGTILEMICGSSAGCASASGFMRDAQVQATWVGIEDTVNNGVPITKWHVVVTVYDYNVTSFTPFFSRTFKGKPIVATQPMECDVADCSNLEASN